MAGRESKSLLPRDIERLEKFKAAKRLSIPQLKLAMAAPFKWGVLRSALNGDPIWILNHKFIVEWLDAHCPAPPEPPTVDGKSAAAGELVSQDGD